MRVRFRPLREGGRAIHGMCEDGTITINLMTRANVANTFIHEAFHALHPEWSEKQVRKETAKRWRKMNTRQRFELYKEIFCRPFVGKEEGG